jgi:hypothetical protein
MLGGAGPRSPLSSCTADRPNRRDARRRRCIGSALIQALAAAAASAQLRYKQLLSLSCSAAQAPAHRLALVRPTALTGVMLAAAASSARLRFKHPPPLLRRLSSDTNSCSRSRARRRRPPLTA